MQALRASKSRKRASKTEHKSDSIRDFKPQAIQVTGASSVCECSCQVMRLRSRSSREGRACISEVHAWEESVCIPVEPLAETQVENVCASIKSCQAKCLLSRFQSRQEADFKSRLHARLSSCITPSFCLEGLRVDRPQVKIACAPIWSYQAELRVYVFEG